MELKVKASSVQNSALGNRIHLKLDDASTAHEKSMYIEKRRNSDSIDVTIDDPENTIKQGDDLVLSLTVRKVNPVVETETVLEAKPTPETDENPNSLKESPEAKLVEEPKVEGEQKPE